jgi:hypothetical protein
MRKITGNTREKGEITKNNRKERTHMGKNFKQNVALIMSVVMLLSVAPTNLISTTSAISSDMATLSDAPMMASLEDDSCKLKAESDGYMYIYKDGEKVNKADWYYVEDTTEKNFYYYYYTDQNGKAIVQLKKNLTTGTRNVYEYSFDDKEFLSSYTGGLITPEGDLVDVHGKLVITEKNYPSTKGFFKSGNYFSSVNDKYLFVNSSDIINAPEGENDGLYYLYKTEDGTKVTTEGWYTLYDDLFSVYVGEQGYVEAEYVYETKYNHLYKVFDENTKEFTTSGVNIEGVMPNKKYQLVRNGLVLDEKRNANSISNAEYIDKTTDLNSIYNINEDYSVNFVLTKEESNIKYYIITKDNKREQVKNKWVYVTSMFKANDSSGYGCFGVAYFNASGNMEIYVNMSANKCYSYSSTKGFQLIKDSIYTLGTSKSYYVGDNGKIDTDTDQWVGIVSTGVKLYKGSYGEVQYRYEKNKMYEYGTGTTSTLYTGNITSLTSSDLSTLGMSATMAGVTKETGKSTYKAYFYKGVLAESGTITGYEYSDGTLIDLATSKTVTKTGYYKDNNSNIYEVTDSNGTATQIKSGYVKASDGSIYKINETTYIAETVGTQGTYITVDNKVYKVTDIKGNNTQITSGYVFFNDKVYNIGDNGVATPVTTAGVYVADNVAYSVDTEGGATLIKDAGNYITVENLAYKVDKTGKATQIKKAGVYITADSLAYNVDTTGKATQIKKAGYVLTVDNLIYNIAESDYKTELVSTDGDYITVDNKAYSVTGGSVSLITSKNIITSNNDSGSNTVYIVDGSGNVEAVANGYMLVDNTMYEVINGEPSETTQTGYIETKDQKLYNVDENPIKEITDSGYYKSSKIDSVSGDKASTITFVNNGKVSTEEISPSVKEGIDSNNEWVANGGMAFKNDGSGNYTIQSNYTAIEENGTTYIAKVNGDNSVTYLDVETGEEITSKAPSGSYLLTVNGENYGVVGEKVIVYGSETNGFNAVRSNVEVSTVYSFKDTSSSSDNTLEFAINSDRNLVDIGQKDNGYYCFDKKGNSFELNGSVWTSCNGNYYKLETINGEKTPVRISYDETNKVYTYTYKTGDWAINYDGYKNTEIYINEKMSIYFDEKGVGVKVVDGSLNSYTDGGSTYYLFKKNTNYYRILRSGTTGNYTYTIWKRSGSSWGSKKTNFVINWGSGTVYFDNNGKGVKLNKVNGKDVTSTTITTTGMSLSNTPQKFTDGYYLIVSSNTLYAIKLKSSEYTIWKWNGSGWDSKKTNFLISWISSNKAKTVYFNSAGTGKEITNKVNGKTITTTGMSLSNTPQSFTTEYYLIVGSNTLFAIKSTSSGYNIWKWNGSDWKKQNNFLISWDSGNKAKTVYFNSSGQGKSLGITQNKIPATGKALADNTLKQYYQKDSTNKNGQTVTTYKYLLLKGTSLYSIQYDYNKTTANKVYYVKKWNGKSWDNRLKNLVISWGSGTKAKTVYFNSSNGQGKVITKGKWTSFGTGSKKYYVGKDSYGNVIYKNGDDVKLKYCAKKATNQTGYTTTIKGKKFVIYKEGGKQKIKQ